VSSIRPLPAHLDAVLNEFTSGLDLSDLRRSAQRTSETYRHEYGRMDQSAVVNRIDTLAYLGYRFPATYAAVRSVFAELVARRPGFVPLSVLDVGAGPGTATLAAWEAWSETITGAAGDSTDGQFSQLIEKSPIMIDLARNIIEGLSQRGMMPVLEPSYVCTDVTARVPLQGADLVVAAYLLGELPTRRVATLIGTLWRACKEVVVLVEPGTPAGYATIQTATLGLAGMGAHILAPVAMNWDCLASSDDWLHFSVRVPRSRLARSLKQAELGHEDEKFSYLIASRRSGRPFAARVVRHPQIRAGHIRLRICTENGVGDVVVPRSRRTGYAIAKRLDWGDAISQLDLTALLP